MPLALVLVVAAVVAALLTGGSWAGLADLPLRARRLVVAAVAAQLAGAGLAAATGAGALYAAGLVVSALAVGAFCWRNIRIAGVGLVALGLAANALVVASNGSMPVSADAAARARVSLAGIADGSDPRHSVAGAGTRLGRLGDDIPLPLPWRPAVVSPGDALVAAGLGEFVLIGMRRRRSGGGQRGQASQALRTMSARS